VELSAGWAKEHRLDALVSTDGDSDRPLTADEKGRFIRGDVSGILVAQFLGADAVALPVSCNTALEGSKSVAHIRRTRIGSPYVIAGMQELARTGAKGIVGYEANGGFLTYSSFEIPGGSVLSSLATRDAVIVHLALLVESRKQKITLSELCDRLPQRFTASDRDQGFATARSQALLERLLNMSDEEIEGAIELGPLDSRDTTDGLRLSFQSGEVLHLRPSGNAPELRCYAEAAGAERAEILVRWGLEKASFLAPGL
jgi:phosphomannomutase